MIAIARWHLWSPLGRHLAYLALGIHGRTRCSADDGTALRPVSSATDEGSRPRSDA